MPLIVEAERSADVSVLIHQNETLRTDFRRRRPGRLRVYGSGRDILSGQASQQAGGEGKNQAGFIHGHPFATILTQPMSNGIIAAGTGADGSQGAAVRHAERRRIAREGNGGPRGYAHEARSAGRNTSRTLAGDVRVSGRVFADEGSCASVQRPPRAITEETKMKGRAGS